MTSTYGQHKMLGHSNDRFIAILSVTTLEPLVFLELVSRGMWMTVKPDDTLPLS